MQRLELVLECTHRFSVCAQHYDQVLSNPILYPQWALCNHYETVETRNQSSHQSFYCQRRSQAVTSIAPHPSIQHSSTLFSPLNLIFSLSLWLLLFSSLFLTQYQLLNLHLLSSSRMCTWTSTASCQWATGCWSRVTMPRNRSNRSQVSWRRSGRHLLQRWMSAAHCWRCQPVFTRNVTR